MSQSNDRLLQIADTLEHINEQLILLSIDTEHYAMALQAVQTNDPVSQGVIQAVIAALLHCSETHCLPLMPANRWTTFYPCLKWR